MIFGESDTSLMSIITQLKNIYKEVSFDIGSEHSSENLFLSGEIWTIIIKTIPESCVHHFLEIVLSLPFLLGIELSGCLGPELQHFVSRWQE
jgi:hypothetical protein